MANTELLKLHLGCGKKFIPGYYHVDLDTHPHIDRYANIGELGFLSDRSASVIYSCHAFEYFDRVQAKEILKEWHRVLVPGGVLRLAVPDFEGLLKVYQKTGELGRILGPMYGRIEVTSNKGAETFYHKTVYDFRSLKSTLEQAGFVAVERFDWQQTEHAHVDDFSQAYFPHMDKKDGLLISLNVEARKE